jgi:hypothetical protein
LTTAEWVEAMMEEMKNKKQKKKRQSHVFRADL